MKVTKHRKQTAHEKFICVKTYLVQSKKIYSNNVIVIKDIQIRRTVSINFKKMFLILLFTFNILLSFFYYFVAQFLRLMGLMVQHLQREHEKFRAEIPFTSYT